jgi:APA family basic amino acid/polyamine antiporter
MEGEMAIALRPRPKQPPPPRSPLIRRGGSAGGLSRAVGVPGLFATAYGNVGSSIYYALGLVAIHALGLTPVVFLVAGLLFMATAYSYAEGASMYPEAGGSSSFARHAFNELVSFIAGWALSLDYIITIAISAVFVPHYLSAFWPPLAQSPWDVIGGIVVIAFLAAVNIRGVKESASLNVFLAVADLTTQMLLVLLGALLIFRPDRLASNVHFGVAPSLTQLIFGLSLGMIAYTGIETISNMAEEARNPDRDVPRAVNYVLAAVLSLYAGISVIAMMALPVYRTAHGTYTTLLAQSPPHGYAEDPVLGIVSQLPLHVLATGLRFYVAILAATILIIATNAGLIGVSRLNYSLSQHFQLPEIASRIHPRYQTPYVAILFYSAVASALLVPGMFFTGESSFLGDMYSYGAMLSFTTAHIAIIALRCKEPDRVRPFRIRGNVRIRGRLIPLPAVIGGIGTGAAWVIVLVLHVYARYVGTAWMILGLVGYVVYRRRQGMNLTESRKRVIATSAGPQFEVEFRSILIPVTTERDRVPPEVLETAMLLAGERRSIVTVLGITPVPLDRAVDDADPGERERFDRLVGGARAVADRYGVRLHATRVRTRTPAAAILADAAGRNAEVIVLGATGMKPPSIRRRDWVDPIAREVARDASQRVMFIHESVPAAA